MRNDLDSRTHRSRKLHVGGSPGALRAGFDLIRGQMDVPGDFAPEVVDEVERAARAPTPLAVDRTDIELVTIDPATSMDLDQAVHIERRAHGYRVHYAIADVAGFVRPGGAIDIDTHERGTTLYMPDRRVPLHHPRLSEGAASLLPQVDRPALLWTIELDAAGDQTAVEVSRATVRSRAKLSYGGVQRDLDAGTAGEPLVLMREVGMLRTEREADRNGVSLPIPDQEVVEDDGSYSLLFRAPLPVERWNAQISLLTGMAAAELMMYGEIGILRTMPDPSDRALRRLRLVARALEIDWPDEVSYPGLIRTLDPALSRHAALLNEASGLLRGAGYTAFVGGVPEQATHAAVAAEYAHVTAPLRRLADRYAGEVCLALCAGVEVPDWVRAELSALPATMAKADQRASAVEGACVSLVEAALLSGSVGETFDGVVIDVTDDGDGGAVQLVEPAVRGPLDGTNLPLGERIRVRLTEADITTRQIRFTPA